MLEIEFANGGVYEYTDVPAEVYRALMSANSKGNYFDRHIRSAPYTCRRIS